MAHPVNTVEQAPHPFTRVFLPFTADATDRMLKKEGRFAYYTTVETAVKILRSREIWMRETSVMNDFTEIDHGLHCMHFAYRSEAGKKFQAAINACFEGLTCEIEQLFDSWIPAIRTNTFATCLSEHYTEDDRYGRLSMWRAYGGNSGVAMIFNSAPMFRSSDVLGAYASPVAYFEKEALGNELSRVAQLIRNNISYATSLGRDGLKDTVFNILRFAIVSTKHPAFEEEREWRVVSTIGVDESEILKPHVEVIGGVAQRILKIPLQDRPEGNLYGVELPQFLDRILVGPCAHSDAICEALQLVLNEVGVPNAGLKIIDTQIPLRPNQR